MILNVIFLKTVFYFNAIDNIIYSLFIILPLILCIAFFTLAERKGMASIQRRIGPNIVGFWGILQPFADAIKLIFKEIIFPFRSNKFVFILCPFISLFFSFLSWFAIVFNPFIITSSLNYGILYNLVISSLSVYGIFLAGWSSNSKYALFGAIRGISQLISYEIATTFVILPIVLIAGSFNYNIILYKQLVSTWYIFPLFPLAICFMICALAETNRIPFDLVEAEAELVAGYNVEYGGFFFCYVFFEWV